jgi:hypothetical protein
MKVNREKSEKDEGYAAVPVVQERRSILTIFQCQSTRSISAVKANGGYAARG